MKYEIVKLGMDDYELKYNNDLDDIIVPKLIIQPLIENAYVHGLKNKKGKIEVTCNKIEDTIEINVINDGDSVDKESIANIDNKLQRFENIQVDEKNGSHGIALINIQKRLKLMYGSNANLNVYFSEDNKVISSIKIKMEI